MGDREEEDFFLILEILERTQNMFAADLDHTSSLEEAKAMLKEKTYGLVWSGLSMKRQSRYLLSC